jgi:hypothetical protein
VKINKLVVLSVLVILLAVGTIVGMLMLQFSSNTPANTKETIKEVTGYSDGPFTYTCSRPIKARLEQHFGAAGQPESRFVPIDPAEANLFCFRNSTPENPAIENEGKIKILQRSEVLEMIRPYAYQDVSVKALEFGKVRGFTSDTAFAQWFARYLERGDGRKREIGCIIVVETPGPKKVYLEDEKLEVFEELDYAVFEHYLERVNPADRKLFLDNLR